MVLAFVADGSGECVVSNIRLRVEPPSRLGMMPIEVGLIARQEPVTGVEAALAAGWQTEGRPSQPVAV